jgi:glutamyl-tRNA synthetase
LTAFFFAGRVPVRVEDLRSAKLDDLGTRQALHLALVELDALREWNVAGIEGVLTRIASVLGKKVRDIARPFYVAITGSPTSVPLYDAMDLLGREVVRERLRFALELLGTPTKREIEDWKELVV